MGDRLNIDSPRWDQKTFLGRLYHFANITDPRLAFVSTQELIDARDLLNLYRQKREPPNTTKEQLYRAQKLYHSAFHPDTGELQNVFGRMSFQVPGGTVLIAAMITWYKSTPAVIFWQWANQSFNALVNYTNRNAKSTITPNVLTFSYCTATSAAVVTALGLKRILAKSSGSLIQRLVPLMAVYAAQCVNVPLMRQSEIKNGIALFDENGTECGKSQLAAVKAVSTVVFCRNIIATPSMLFTPIIMEMLEKRRLFRKYRIFMNTPFQTFFSALFLLPMVPIGCALFPQKNSISTSTLKQYEPKSLPALDQRKEFPHKLYFNKGL